MLFQAPLVSQLCELASPQLQKYSGGAGGGGGGKL